MAGLFSRVLSDHTLAECLRKRILINLLLGFVVGVLTSVSDFLTGCEFKYLAYNIIGSTIGGYLIWTGSEFISGVIAARYDWLHQPMRRALYQLAYNVVYVVVVISLIIKIVSLLEGKSVPLFIWFQNVVIALLLTTIVNLIYISFDLYNYWKTSKYESEMLKKENLRSQLETLKNQTNPHFLFNSLNTLDQCDRRGYRNSKALCAASIARVPPHTASARQRSGDPAGGGSIHPILHVYAQNKVRRKFAI